MDLLFGFVVAGAPLLIVEVLSRNKKLRPELGRKVSHVGSAIAVLTLPFFLTLRQIAVIALAYTLIMLFTRSIGIWKSLYAVSRSSWGEVLFPAGVLAASFFATSVDNFMCAVAIMGFADTAAALVGMKFGKKRIAGTQKTFAGSLAFALVSTLILFTIQSASLPFALVVIGAATLDELFSPFGTDNLTIPIVVVLLLNIGS